MKKWFSVPIRKNKLEKGSVWQLYVVGGCELQVEERLQVGHVLYCKFLCFDVSAFHCFLLHCTQR